MNQHQYIIYTHNLFENACTEVYKVHLHLSVWKVDQCRTRCDVPDSEDHELKGWTCYVSKIQQPLSPLLPPLLHSTQVCKG